MAEVTRFMETDPTMCALIKKGHTIEVEKDKNDYVRIKLIQKIPDKIQILLQNKEWLLRLFWINFALINKHQDDKVKTFQDKGRMQGGDAGLAHLIVLQLESGKELNYVLKCSGTDENAF